MEISRDKSLNREGRWRRCLLTTAYLPPVSYFVAIAQSDSAVIEVGENYQKQSYRSRCNILTSNGVQKLSIPIRRGGEEFTHSIPIDKVANISGFSYMHISII